MKKIGRKLAMLSAFAIGASLHANATLTNEPTAKEVAKDKRRRKDTLEETTANNGKISVWAQPQPIYIPTRSQKIKRKRMLKRMSN